MASSKSKEAAEVGAQQAGGDNIAIINTNIIAGGLIFNPALLVVIVHIQTANRHQKKRRAAHASKAGAGRFVSRVNNGR
jgi:hypothetical protein